MIDPVQLDRKTADLMALIREKFGVKAPSLEQAVRKLGRRLPKRLQGQAGIIVEAQKVAGHPKLMLQVDAARVEAAFEAIKLFLRTVDPADRRKGAVLGWLGATSFNLIALVVLLLAFLRWRGVL